MTRPLRRKYRNNKNPRQSGAILLFALLIMSSVVIGSIGLGTIILDMLQQTRISDDSVLAYYAAESGVEEAIFNARKTGNIPPSYDIENSRSLNNGATWFGDVAGTTEIIYTNIDQHGFTEVNLYDPDSPADFSKSNISKVVVTWSNPASVLKASVVSWLPGGQVNWEDDAARFENPFEFVGGTAELTLGPPNKLYKLRLRAKNDSLDDVTIRAYDAADVAQPLPGQVVIDFTGRHMTSRRRLIATMPRGAPLSGIFEFVLFSECSLVKGGRPISCP